jgi:hypothetical protein
MGATVMSKDKVVPISAGVQGKKRQRVRVQVSKGAGIQIEVQLVPEGPARAVAEAGVAAADAERKYWIAADDTIHVLAPEAPAPPDAVVLFSGLQELEHATAEWPMRQFVRVWNQLPGNAPVARFENRRIAAARLWQVIQKLEEGEAVCEEMTRTEQAKSKPSSKTQCVISLLQAPEVVTLGALMQATGWQAHSVRGFLSGKVSKELGLPVTSFRREGERVYQVSVLGDTGVSKGEEK